MKVQLNDFLKKKRGDSMYSAKPITSKTFPVLESVIFERGIKKKDIAEKLNISIKALSNKIAGKNAFTWDEVCTMQKYFFPDISKERLLQRNKPA